MKYIGENAIKKLISLIKDDLATKQPTITASGLLKGDGAGTVTAADTQEATLVDVPNGLLKGDGTTISAAVAETDYMVPPTGGTTGQVLKKTETGTEWANESGGTQSASQTVTLTTGGWTQSGDRYSQTVNVTGVTASTPVVLVDIAMSGTDLDADAASLEAWGIVSANNVAQGAGTLTFYALIVPSVNIPVNVGVC